MSPVQITCSGSQDEFLEQLQEHHRMMKMFQKPKICEFALGGVPIPCYDIKNQSSLYNNALQAALQPHKNKTLDCDFLVTVMYLHLMCYKWSNGQEISDNNVSTHEQLLIDSNLQNSYTLKFATQSSNKRKKEKKQSDKPVNEPSDEDLLQIEDLEKESVHGALNQQMLLDCCRTLNLQLYKWFTGDNMQDKRKCSEIEQEVTTWKNSDLKREFSDKKTAFFQFMRTTLKQKSIDIEAEFKKEDLGFDFFVLLAKNCSRFFTKVLSKMV